MKESYGFIKSVAPSSRQEQQEQEQQDAQRYGISSWSKKLYFDSGERLAQLLSMATPLDTSHLNTYLIAFYT